MSITKLTFLTVLLTSLTAAGCGGGATPPANTSNVANTVAANDDPVGTTAKKTAGATNDAPTLTPVFKAYCDAMVKKDEAAIRKLYTSDTIKDFEKQMKDDNIKSLMTFLEDDQVTGKTCTVRNEEIEGDKAVAEISLDAYPNGIKVIFRKENGEWKLTNESPVLESKPAAK